jgi:hypothetical protein
MKNRSLRLEITVNSSEPALLQGLDDWLRLGLIEEFQVRQIAKYYLICPLPDPVPEFATQTNTPQQEFIREELPPVVLTPTRQRQNILSQAWQSFKDEISVRWLLFLGLFLVVISSAVLAATQWQRFPDALQYGVLWTYTLIFWGIGFWATRQENLQLTAQTLQTIALLLIPVNFWAMDGLGKNPLEWLTVAIASISLTGIYLLYRRSSGSIFLFFNFIGLSYLHWGWEFASYPLISVYIGIIATAVILRFFPLQQINSKIGKGFVSYALSVLLIRAIFIVNLPIQQLGLAIGICGWLMQGNLVNSKQDPSLQETLQEQTNSDDNEQDALTTAQYSLSRILETVGAILLFLGWLVCVGERVPWQAMAVSGLGLHFFAQRLGRDWLRRDLLAIFIIGLQAHFLIGRLIPKGFQQEAIDLSVQIANSQNSPWTVYGITLFPYIIFFVLFTGWLYRHEKAKLAYFGEWLTFGLGILMSAIAFNNPTWRSLNLFFSTAILVYVVHHRLPIRVILLYFTHALGLLTICVTIDWWFPSLSTSTWACVFLGLMVGEWGCYSLAELQRRRGRQKFSLTQNPKPARSAAKIQYRIKQYWCRSCWHFGFVLASASYPLLWERVETFLRTKESQAIVLSWLLTPLMLTGVAMLTRRKKSRQAAQFSSYALIIAQFLTLWQPSTRLISLGIASGLMLVNSCYFRHQSAAIIQVGFSLSFVVALLWNKLSISSWFLLGAIAIFSLWLLGNFLREQRRFLASLYGQAADKWAIALFTVELGLLTLKSLNNYLVSFVPHWHYLATPIVIGIAIFYRYRQQLSNTVIYSLAWTIEIALCEGLFLLNGSLLNTATVNILLGLGTLLFTHWLFKKSSHLSQLTSLKMLPFLFAGLGIFWRWEEFTAYTGLLTLGAAFIGIGVSSRFRNGKVITYLSLIGISLACYELVIYQMLQAASGSPADGLTILAIVAASLALIYRVFAAFLQSKEVNNFLNLSLSEIKILAHAHWALGSALKIFAAGIAVENTPRLRIIGIAISLILAIYALIQGRDKQTSSDRTFSDWWVYVGLVEIVASAVYARLLWEQLSILDPFRIIITCLVALLIYQIPWRSLGWEATPWHRFALVIPALSTFVNLENISYLSLLIIAAFYLRIAYYQKEIRWTYVSLGFIDWAIARFLFERNLTDILWYALIIGLSLLYVAQFDTTLKQPQQRNNRHLLRLTGSGIICFIALLFHQEMGGLTPTMISLGVIFVGLALQIRAFLFIGTINFILTGFYQLIILSFEYSLAKWIIGLIAGILFIFIAANFERRREEIIRVLQNWLEKLNRWQ